MPTSAFVGHSFSPEDADIVRKFLDFFSHVSDLGLNFSWDHAEDAELKDLSIKVREKMEGKNLFIAICTPRQQSVDVGKMYPTPFNKKILWTNATDLVLKTSDWILQEIGFACGRDMKTLILLEKGVKIPGGIQGNVEYIEFDRNYPEQSFTKILEMLRSITLSPQKSGITEIVELKPVQEQNTAVPQEIPASDKPISEWTIDDYEFEQFMSIAHNDQSKSDELRKQYLNSPYAANHHNIVRWNARWLGIKMLVQHEHHLTELLAMLESDPEHPDVLFYVGKAYELYNEHERAARHFEKAALNLQDNEKKLERLSNASIAYAKAGNKDRTTALIKQCVEIVRAFDKGRSFLYNMLADICLEIGNDDEYKIFSEAFLELSPESHNTRFSLAYKYGETGANSAALYHYRLLTSRNPSSTNWNNLGVALSNLKLPALAVRAYRASEKMDGTLAMSNLGHKFISEGFLDEASDLAQKAIGIKDYDERIGLVIAKIQETKEKEETEHSKLIDGFKKVRQFYIDFSKAYIGEEIKSIPMNWQGPKCKLLLTIQDGTLEASGMYEKIKQPSWLSTVQKPTTVTECIKYIGVVNGCSVNYKYWIAEGNMPDTLGTPQGSGLMYIDDIIQNIHIYESGSKEDEGFSKWCKINEPTSENISE